MLKKLPFDKKLFCFAIGLLMTAIFAAINNHYFYKNREHTFQSHYNDLNRVLSSAYHQCKSSQHMKDCNQYLLELVELSGIRGIVAVEVNGNEVYRSNSHRFGLERKEVGRDFLIDDGLSIYLGRLVTPPLWQSTFRSITFSAMDWPSVIMSGQNPVSFAKFVAWPRSAPTFSAGILVFLVIFIVRAHASALLNKNLEQRHKINELGSELQMGSKREQALEEEREHLNKKSMAERARREKLDLELASIRKELESAAGQEEIEKYEEKIRDLEEIIESSWEESYASENRMQTLEKEKAEMKKELEEKEKEIRFYQAKTDVSLSKNQKKLIASILLESPDVKKSSSFKAEAGKHHSKDYVKKIYSAIERNPRSKELVTKIFPKAYVSKKRGCCELFVEEVGEGFYLDVYDFGDEGYAAKIMLSGDNHWQAIAEAKYIINAVKIFQGMTFEDKTKL